jgi:hypothetical protein
LLVAQRMRDINTVDANDEVNMRYDAMPAINGLFMNMDRMGLA